LITLCDVAFLLPLESSFIGIQLGVGIKYKSLRNNLFSTDPRTDPNDRQFKSREVFEDKLYCCERWLFFIHAAAILWLHLELDYTAKATLVLPWRRQSAAQRSFVRRRPITAAMAGTDYGCKSITALDQMGSTQLAAHV
jgi:hypothetical protein